MIRYIKYALLFFTIILVTGCWNYRELNELSIVNAIGIDIDNDLYDVSISVFNTKKVSSNTGSGGNASNETSTVTYKSKAKTIKEAIMNMNREAPKELYIGHVDIVVISDEVARKGVEEFADFFMSDTESRKVFPFLVVKNGKAVDVLKILTPLETITSSNIKDSLEAMASNNSMVSSQQFDEFIMGLYQEGRDPTAASVEILGSPEEGSSNNNLETTMAKTSVKITGIAAFKDDKLVGYLDGENSLGYTILHGKAKSIDISFPCDDKDNCGNAKIDGIKVDTKMKIKKDQPVAEIKITGSAALPELNCDIDTTETKNLDKIEKMIDKKLEGIIEETIKKAQTELNSDIFGFGEKLYKNNYKYWEENKTKWDQIFPTIKYKIDSNIKIVSVESTIRTAKEG